MKHKKILFVCTGNTCRSPMAEAALKAELKARKIRWYSVQSAGLRASDGQPMNGEAARTLREAGLPVPPTFAARQLTSKLIEEAHVVICMTEAQRLSLKGFAGVTSMQQLAGREISDPYGQGADAYRAALEDIIACLPPIIQAIIE